MTGPRRRVWRGIKWGGIVSCALLAMTTLFSAYWSVYYGSGGAFTIGLANGAVMVTWEPPAAAGPVLYDFSKGWRASRLGPNQRWVWRPSVQGAWKGIVGMAVVPLWTVFTLAVLVSVVAWRRGRIRPGWCTKCGYDIRGMTAGAVCPECGAATGGVA